MRAPASSVAEVAVTHDALFDGALSLKQPAKRTGYRVNVDAILLAAFAAHRLDAEAAPKRYRHAVDLGAGVGAVALSMLHFDAAERVTLVEIDAALADLAVTNARDNGFDERAEVENKSVTDLTRPESPKAQADLVVCNPPYVPPGRGRIPSASVAGAKYGKLDIFVDAARRVAGKRARACFVYPAIELTSLLDTLRARGLEPKRLRFVHTRASEKARVALVECAAGKPGGLEVEAPFVEMEGRARAAGLVRLLGTSRG